jgi:uracil-DNA glycosylase
MDSFDAALDLVHDALSALQARGANLSASRESLARLSAVAQAAPRERPSAPVPTLAPARPVEQRSAAVLPPPPLAPFAVPTAATAPILPPTPILPFAAPARPAAPAPETSALSKAERLDALRGPVLVCTKCPALVRSRTQVVFGVGNPEAELMFVGEAPGEDEDRQGEPFVGKAGQLLTKIIETMGFSRAEVFIGNVLKCRPDMPPNTSGNRKPTSAEMQTCLPYLEQQIAIIQPRALVALGATAVEGLLGETLPVGRLRGRWHEFRGIPLMPTYHPSYLLRSQSLGEKRKVWEDMLLVLEHLGRPISEKQRGFFLQKG